MRLLLGAGWLSTATSAGSVGETQVGSMLSLAIGDSFLPNVAFYMELLRGASFGPSPSSTMWGVGPGVAYYIMPANVYLSATLFVSRVTVERFGISISTDFGLGGAVSVGKEWWASQQVGVGLTAHMSFTSASAGNATFMVGGLVLALSATYN